ncbi:MAG: GFA family protein [Alphaproteobacteria bacterium]
MPKGGFPAILMTMTQDDFTPVEGGCACGAVRFSINARPLIVHCCHCHSCQRETGSAFAVNILIEASQSPIHSGTTERFAVPTDSGNPHAYHRCSGCHGTVWHEYVPPGAMIRFIPSGMLDAGHGIEPDIHIFTDSRQPWVPIPDGVRSVPQFYDYGTTWRPDSFARLKAAKKAEG